MVLMEEVGGGWWVVGCFAYLHYGCPEVNCFRANGAVKELREATLTGFRLRGSCALISPSRQSHLSLEVLSECLAEAQAESGGHLDLQLLFVHES